MMTPHDYQTIGRLNQADHLRERAEMRLAKLVTEDAVETAPGTPKTAPPPASVRRSMQWLRALVVSAARP